MIIHLTPDIEEALAEEARKLGTTPEQLALDSLRERFVPSDADTAPTEEKDTLADFLRGHIGVLDSREYVAGGAGLSQDSHRKFAEGLTAEREQKRS